MKKLALTLLLMQTPLLLASKPNPSEYPLTVHVQCSYLRFQPGLSPSQQRLGVSLNGKPVELTAQTKYLRVLALGDYKARQLRSLSDKSYDVQQSYELLLPDGKVRSFQVTGFGPNVCSAPPQ